MEKTKNDFIRENQKEIQSLKKQNLYCLKQITNKDNALWVKKEYKQVIRDNLERIRELANHNKILGGFK